MRLIPLTLEGRSGWFLAVVGQLLGVVGIVMLFRHGFDGLQEMTSARMLFPFAMLSARMTDSFFGVPVLFLFLQYLIYAVALVIGNSLDRLGPTVAAIGVAHITVVLLCFLLP